MSAFLVTGPGVEPLSLAEAKAGLRIDSTDEDLLLTSLILAARGYVEQFTRRRLIAQTWRVVLDQWPQTSTLPIPIAPLISLDAVRVRDGNGVATVVPTSLYRVDLTSDPARLCFVGQRPEPGVVMAGIEVDVTAGYGTAATGVPEPLRQAIRMLVAQWFENRGDGAGVTSPALERDIAALLAPFVRRRLA
jgi:uncharacterized phiE125 gp8 family phage protein